MAGLVWNEQLFPAELIPEIAARLRAGHASALTAAMDLCVETAEALCGERVTACGPGCPHCCVLNVAVLLPEAAVIAGWLRERLHREELGRLAGQLVYHCCWVRWMDDDERIFRGASCPFLDSAGKCSIHPVRPLACRGVASLDNDACRAAFSPSCSGMNRLVPADLQRRAVYDAAFMGLAQALRQCGLNNRSIELGTGVRAFLEFPHYAQAFLCGEQLAGLWEA